MDPFTFATSGQLQMNVSIRINNLEGQKPPIPQSELLKNPALKRIPSNVNPNSELYITVQLYADNKPLGVPVQTSYKYFKNGRVWNEWLTLPVIYSDLPVSSQLAITIWDLSPEGPIPFGGTTVKLFDKDHTLKKGRQKCKVWMDVEADGQLESTTDSHVVGSNEMDRLEKLIKKHEMGEIPRIDWLDNLVFRKIEQLQKEHSEETTDHFLFVDFPRFDFPIVFADYEYPPLAESIDPAQEKSTTSTTQSVAGGPVVQPGAEGVPPMKQGGLMKVWDPEALRKDNPCETKHMTLVRSQRNGPSDRDLKPNARIRDQLNDILKYPPTHELNPDEKNVVWKFRYYLTRDKRALTKFLKSVVWTDTREVRQVLELLPKWAEIDVDDALELLGQQFTHANVRNYAVERLRKADDNELSLYLLQLVQALKFDRRQENTSGESGLSRFLISRAAGDEVLGTLLHWYLMVECEDMQYKRLYSKIAYDFMTTLVKIPDPDGTYSGARRNVLLKQAKMIESFMFIAKDIQDMKVRREKKIERLKQFLADPNSGLVSFDPLPLPLDPSLTVVGMYPNESTVFKSSLSPLMMTFKTSDGSKYPILFKSGDDLRQDQLVIQIIILMDQLLRKENLDLRLSPYRILATSVKAGMMQFVPSKSIAGIVADHQTILNFLKLHNPDPTSREGVKMDVMDTYVKSCAGYCVITYLLGVGDRHLDNLLVTNDGHFFHADFGYILGRDPKIFAPQMKLCKEMVDGMGGSESVHFQNFRSYCFTAYTTLRKSANLILNLFALMIDANIPDIKIAPDMAVIKVQEKFALEVSEEEALRTFDQLIIDSLSALFPVVIDRLHGLAQYWKS